MNLPRILVIDDTYGRQTESGVNSERSAFCANLLLRDVSGGDLDSIVEVTEAQAEAIFMRGQMPLLSKLGDSVENDLSTTIEAVSKVWESPEDNRPSWSLVLLDLCFLTGPVTPESNRAMLGAPAGRPEDSDPSRYFGLAVLRALRKRCPDLPVIILSSQPNDERVALSYAEAGALGFLAKDDLGGDELLRQYLERYGLLEDDGASLLGSSRPLLRALRTARTAAGTRHNVLILGESGTGKELLARYIHRKSSAAQQPLVEVNSGSLSEELFQSELYGHVKGAFTSADKEKVGKMVLAQRGDLYFDEVGTLPTRVQEALLRTLEELRIEPLGSNKPVSVDFRVLAATNADMPFLLETKLFRFDLHERLTRGGSITLPPLRDRPGDIPFLAENFLGDERRKAGKEGQQTITPEALILLQNHKWPGNVRELRNVMSRLAATYADLPYIVPHHVEAVLPVPSKAALLFPAHSADSGDVLTGSSPVSSPVVAPRDTSAKPPLEDLYRYLETFPFDGRPIEELRGQLPKLIDAILTAVSALLRAAIRHYPKRKQPGEYYFEPAFKDVAADESLTAVDAYDFIKRLFKLWPASAAALRDPVIRSLHERSRRGRSSTKSQGGDASGEKSKP